MLEQILEFLEHAGVAISLCAVAVIVVGFALVAGRYALRFRDLGPEQDFRRFKIEIAGHHHRPAPTAETFLPQAIPQNASRREDSH